MASPMATSYDAVPYDSTPYADTHPGRLYTIARLFGLNPKPIDRCRVLELGCAAGGNIIPMAEALPESQFLGIDLSARQGSAGQQFLRELKLPNVEIRHASITDVDDSYGQFDYILSHGVYSWVPTEVQERMLEICDKHLAPDGVAYISYNVFPGWHMRGMVRDMMRYHAMRFPDPNKRIEQARALLDFLVSASRLQEGSAFASMLRNELDLLRRVSDSYLYHDHLAEVNEPIYFHEFVDRASRHNLKYLAEARIGLMIPGNLGPEVEKSLKVLGPGLIEKEQFMDFVRNRTFRQTLLVHDKQTPNYNIDPRRVWEMHVFSPGRPASDAPDNLGKVQPVGFKAPGGMVLTTDRPLIRAAMPILFAAYPGTVAFTDLLAQARERLQQAGTTPPPAPQDGLELASGLLNCLLGSNLIDLYPVAQKAVRKPSDRPKAPESARLLAPRFRIVCNIRHEAITLSEFEQRILSLCNGAVPVGDMVSHLTQAALSGELRVEKDGQPLYDPLMVRQLMSENLGRALDKFGEQGLLLA